MNKRTLTLLCIFMTFVIIFSGCSNKKGENLQTSVKSDLIIANTSGEPGNLHPFNTVSIGRIVCSSGIYESLLSMDDDGQVIGCLAESWEHSESEIVFKLRKNVKFHNGVEMTSKDVVFSFNELINNSTGGLAGLFNSIDVDRIEAIDDYTVKVPLDVLDTSLISNIIKDYVVLPADAYLEMGDEFQYKPIGTGPFKYKDWVVGDRVVWERFDDYWGGVAQLDTVIIRTISEVSQAMVEVETGGVDIMINPQGSDVLRVENGEIDGVKAFTVKSAVLRNNNINFNWNSEYIKNEKVREAIARSIDRDSWVNIISPGVGKPAYSNIAAGVWGYDDNVPTNYPHVFDLDRAKKLMEEAGYGDGIEMILLTDARPYHLETVELLQNSLSQIGIKLEVKTMELAQQKEIMVTGEGFDLYTLDNVFSAADPLSGLWRDSHPMFAKTNSSHYHFYTEEDAQGDKYANLLNEIRSTVEDETRFHLCKELQQVFIEDMIWLPINSIQAYVLGNDKLNNIAFRDDILKITNKTSFAD